MNDFKITIDNTIEFTSKKKLYVMLIKSKSKHYIVVDDRHERVGALCIPNVIDEKLQYDFIYDKLLRLNDFASCKSLVQLTFKNRSFVESRFLVHLITTKEITWETISVMRQLHSFDTEYEFATSSAETRHIIKTVHVLFAGHKRSIGKFTREVPGKEFQFIFNQG